MSLAIRLRCAPLAALACAWSAAALGNAFSPPTGVVVAGANGAPLHAAPAPHRPDSVGTVSAGYRSIHFDTTLGGFSFPYQIALDGNTFFVSNYGGNTVAMYQLVGATPQYLRTFGAPGTAAGQFNGPGQIAVVGNYIYVADYFNARIQRFDKTSGAYVSQFGSSGSGNGQLSGPAGLVYNPLNGLLYVSETGNQRVQAFSTSGIYQFAFGSAGAGNGQLTNPFALALDSVGNIYVADTGNNRISKFDASGAWLRNIAVGSQTPYGVAVDAADHVWTTSDTGSIYVYDSRGTYLAYYYGAYDSPPSGDGYFQHVRGIAVTQPLTGAPFSGSSAVIVADGSAGTLQIFSPSAQAIAHPALDSVRVAGAYNFGIAYDTADNVYVASYNDNSITKFDPFGTKLTQWGTAGSGNGQFSGIMGIAIDDSDNVYVADRNNNRIQKFDSNGGYLTQWGTMGSGNGQFNHPSGVATDGAWLYVAEEVNNRVQKFTPTGTYVRQWGGTGTGNGQFQSPEGIAVDRARNQVYVAEYTGARIQQFSVYGDFVKVFGDSISGSGTLSSALGLSLDQRGNVYAADLGNNRVVQYNDNGTYLTTIPVPGANGVAADPHRAQVRIGDLGSGEVTRFGATFGKTDTIGVYRPSTFTFYLRNSLSAGAPDITATVAGAQAGDLPITGDWNGDGIDTPGLFRPSTATFYLWDDWRGLDVATAPYQFAFGANGDKPIVGDWDGDGRDGVGVFRASNQTHYLKNQLVAGVADYSVVFGQSTDLPLGGNWNQSGNDSVGTYRPSSGAVFKTTRNVSGSAPVDGIAALGGTASDLPVAGDWSHNGSSGVGLFRAGTFYLMLNPGTPDGTVFHGDFEAPVLTTVAFGQSGDVPLGGTWGQAPE